MDKLARISEANLKDAPEGYLRLSKSQGCIQYYHCINDEKQNGTYIQKKNLELAKKLAQKSYDEKVLKYANKTQQYIRKLLKEYDDNKIEKIYFSEHQERQKLIVPVEATYKQKLQEWMSKPYKGKEFSEDMPIIRTNKGIRVRSKSEKIIADLLEAMKIEYKYECPLLLKQYGIIYPDFTFLSRRTGQEIYWEHEGMMDNSNYAISAVKKIELYEKNGIYPGENLILTFETSATVINSELIRVMIQKHLL